MKDRKMVSLKKLLLSAALFAGLVVSSAHGQTISSSAVPASAIKAFQASSGGATATWAQGPNRTYEATFLKEGQKMVYAYDQGGVLQQKKVVSKVAAFPANVGSAVAAAYPKGNVEYAYKVVSRTNQKFYEVQVVNPSGVERMRFDLEGKPLGKTTLATTQPVNSQPMAMNATTVPSTPKPTPVVAKTPAPQPVAGASNVTVTKVSPPVAMRGESASASSSKTTAAVKDDLIDDDLGDLLEDDADLDDLMNDDESWDDINLDDDLEDDSDLLDGTGDLDDDLGLDSDVDDDDDL